MKYIVHNKALIGDSEEQNIFEQKIARKISLLDRVLSNYKKNLVLDIYISKINSHLFKVSLSLKLKSKLLYLEDEGNNILLLVNDLLEKFRNIIKKQTAKERKEHLFKRKQRRTESFAEYAHQLDTYYAQKENEQFNHLIKELLPSLKTYTMRYLKTHGHNIKLKISVQEILDEVYINLFDRFNERPSTINNISSWIYGITHEFLERYLEENIIKFEQLDISILAANELKSLEEEYTVDADGEIVLLEELDDISYMNKNYGAEMLPNDAFISYPEIHPLSKDIYLALEDCDEKQRMIFEMYWLDELSEDEIGKSMGINNSEVEKIIKNVTNKIVAHIKAQSQ